MENRQGTTWSFMIVAGGSGSRIGGTPKQFRELGGIPVWRWSLRVAESLSKTYRIIEAVLVVPKDFKDLDLSCFNFKIPVKIVVGGSMRSDSVLNGLKECLGQHVLIHDAARPFLTESLCEELMKKAVSDGAAIPLLESTDSIKIFDEGKISLADRKKIFRTQTPQAFEKEELISVLEKSSTTQTDEASSWILAGKSISMVFGEGTNFKITTQSDWERALGMVFMRTEERTGHGYDVHQLVPGRKLVLAGIEILNSDVGLLGHSDADVITHTVMDAILGAAGEPDIGTIFPASDMKWKDAKSTDLLVEIVDRIRLLGWRIVWVDVTIIAQKPRLGHMITLFRDNLLKFLAEDDGNINLNIKVKSAEECGSVGRGECIVCHAVATIARYKNHKLNKHDGGTYNGDLQA